MATFKLNEQIAFLRKQKGVTQDELARSLGVTNQSVSKWESSACCPDIQLLPAIASYFGVSIDELIGYNPVGKLDKSSKIMRHSWDDSLNFLKAIRSGWFNDDYIRFLVESVWKIRKPVNIVDFGCGFGYVGLLLLPILPEGSTYTGIDISDTLINEAKNNFKDLNCVTNFIKADLNEYIPKESYDIAISQAVLRHIPNAKNILKKMIQSVVSGGMVICMETDLEMEKAGHHFSGLDYIGLGLTPLYTKFYKKELEDGGRDYRFGIKIPIYMQELGLNNVGVRMSDSVKFINPHGNKEDHSKQYDAITSAWGWNKQQSSVEEKNSFIKSMMARGLDKQEAELYVDGQYKISEYVMNNKDNAYIIQIPSTLISYGIK